MQTIKIEKLLYFLQEIFRTSFLCSLTGFFQQNETMRTNNTAPCLGFCVRKKSVQKFCCWALRYPKETSKCVRGEKGVFLWKVCAKGIGEIVKRGFLPRDGF